MTNYSTTYANEIIKIVMILATIFSIELDADIVVPLVTSLVTIASISWTLYQRYQSGKEGRAGAISILGVRK